MLRRPPGHAALTGVLLLLAAALPGTDFAGAAPRTFEACMNAAQSTLEYNECSSAEIARQDRILNDVWRRVSEKMKAFDARAFNSLLNEQRKWIQWKELACQYYQEGFGSEGKSIRYPTCFIGILRDRITTLSALAKEL